MEDTKDWTRARMIYQDMAPALEYLAKWEWAMAKRQATWPIARIVPAADRWRIVIMGDRHEHDRLQMALAEDEDARWCLEAPNQSPIDCGDIEYDAEGHGDGTVLCAMPEDLPIPRNAQGWRLIKMPINFTRELMTRLDEWTATKQGNAALMIETLGYGTSVATTSVAPSADDQLVLTGLNSDQQMAVMRAMTAPLTLIWGPPGTGKTTVIARILEACWRHGETAMILSHTHLAVDGPLIQLAQHLDQSESGRRALVSGIIERWGSRTSPLLHKAKIRGITLAHYLMPDYRDARRHQGQKWIKVAEAAQRLATESADADQQQWTDWVTNQTTLHTVDGRRWMVPATLEPEDLEVLQTEAQRWTDDDSLQFPERTFPQIVGSTITHAFLTENHWVPDVVIVDEVTMSHLPAVAFAALLAGSRIVLAGDFLQLPAIYPNIDQWPAETRTPATRWIARDVFAAHKILPTGLGTAPALVGLREQYRMHTEICEAVNRLAYAPRLPLITRVDPPSPVWPSASARLVLIDTEGYSTATATNKSWVNLPHQEVIQAIVQRLVALNGTQSIGIVTPFRPQAQQLALRLAAYPQVLSATAHRFQGSERAVMVLDPVRIGNWEHHPFLGKTVSALRLWNVALSRAQQQVILVAPASWQGTVIPAWLTQYIRHHGVVIPAAQILRTEPLVPVMP